MTSLFKHIFSPISGRVIGATILLGSFFLIAGAEDEPKGVALPIPERISDSEEDEPVSLEDLKGKSFQELDESRLPRRLLIDYLLEEEKIRESPKGTLDFLEHLNELGTHAVKEENRTRMQMFTLIGEREKRSFASVGREFHLKVTAKPEEKATPKAPVLEVPTSLRIGAPLSMEKSLLPNLVNGYLRSLGYGEVKTETRKDITRMIGRRSFGTGFIAVDLETRFPGSTDEPKEKCVLFETGEAEGSIPADTIALEGLSIVIHPDNPVSTMTVSQVADIFSGKIRQWNRVGGTDQEISVLLPGARPVLMDQFQELVLKPEKEKFIETSPPEEGTAGRSAPGFLDQLASNPNAVAFCRPGEVSDKMQQVRIKASSEAVALSPSPINIKSLDYPLVRYISLRASGSSDSFIREFINYSQSQTGQGTVVQSGYIGIGIAERQDRADPENHRQARLDNPGIPDRYKNLIRKADRLNSPVNLRFVPGTDNFELTEYSGSNLELLSRYLLSHRGQYRKVILIGFADSDGDASANLTYSGKRADSVADRLRERGITSIETAGMGEEMPIANNDRESGRASNRRVEVWIERE